MPQELNKDICANCEEEVRNPQSSNRVFIHEDIKAGLKCLFHVFIPNVFLGILFLDIYNVKGVIAAELWMMSVVLYFLSFLIFGRMKKNHLPHFIFIVSNYVSNNLKHPVYIVLLLYISIHPHSLILGVYTEYLIVLSFWILGIISGSHMRLAIYKARSVEEKALEALKSTVLAVAKERKNQK